MNTGCAKAPSAPQPGLYLSNEGEDAMVPLIAVTDGKGADDNGKPSAYLFERVSIGHWSQVTKVVAGQDLNTSDSPIYVDGAGSIDGPVISYQGVFSDETGLPYLPVSLTWDYRANSKKEFRLTYAPISREQFVQAAMTDERLDVADTVSRWSTDKNAFGTDYTPDLAKFCRQFSWGDRCETLYGEADL